MTQDTHNGIGTALPSYPASILRWKRTEFLSFHKQGEMDKSGGKVHGNPIQEWDGGGASGSDLPSLSSWNISQPTDISLELLLLPENRGILMMTMVDFMHQLG